MEMFHNFLCIKNIARNDFELRKNLLNYRYRSFRLLYIMKNVGIQVDMSTTQRGKNSDSTRINSQIDN